VAIHHEIAKLSVVGVGMKTHSGVAATLFETLATQRINIELISTSEIKISVVISAARADDAARAAHAAFGPGQARVGLRRRCMGRAGACRRATTGV